MKKTIITLLVIAALPIMAIAILAIPMLLTETPKANKDAKALVNNIRGGKFFPHESLDEIIKIGKPSVVPLIAMLKEKDLYLRWNAIIALGKIGDKRAVLPLIKLCKEKDRATKGLVVQALISINDERAIKPLINLIKDKDPDIQGVAILGLEQITKEKYTTYKQWQELYCKNK